MANLYAIMYITDCKIKVGISNTS